MVLRRFLPTLLPLLITLTLAGTNVAIANVTVDCKIPRVWKIIPSTPAPSDPIVVYAQWAGSWRPKFVGGVVSVISSYELRLDIYGSESSLAIDGIVPVSNELQDWFGVFRPLKAGYYVITTRMNWVDSGGVVTSLCETTPYFGLQVDIAGALVEIVQVAEFYNAARDHYFMTSNASEIHDLETSVHPGWQRISNSSVTDRPMQAYTIGRSNGRGGWGVCRFYGSPAAGLDSHFYTANRKECEELINKEWGQDYVGGPWVHRVVDWSFESWGVFEMALPHSVTSECAPGTGTPVYRLWNGRNDSNHRFTKSWDLKQQLVSAGYIAEGWGENVVAICSP